MHIRCRILYVSAALAIAAGCGRSDDDVHVCEAKDPNNCWTYASPVEFNRAMAAEDARQRRLAEGLPFDYHDLLHALLIEYLHSSSFPDVDNQYFVSVFGSDIDHALTTRLHASGIDVQPSSAWTIADPQPVDGRHVSRIKVEVSYIKQVGPETFGVGIGYYCGGLCAAGQMYTLRKDGDHWRVVDRQTHWIA